MLDITFEINGKKVRPDKVGDALEKAILQGVEESVVKSVGSVRCPEHGSQAKIVARGRSVDKLSFDISGCCEQLIEVVEKKLK